MPIRVHGKTRPITCEACQRQVRTATFRVRDDGGELYCDRCDRELQAVHGKQRTILRRQFLREARREAIA